MIRRSKTEVKSKSSQRGCWRYPLNATSFTTKTTLMLLAHFFHPPSFLLRRIKTENYVGAAQIETQSLREIHCPGETKNHIDGNQRKWRVRGGNRGLAPYVEMRPAFLAGTWANSTPWYITPLISMLTTNDEFSPLASPETQ